MELTLDSTYHTKVDSFNILYTGTGSIGIAIRSLMSLNPNLHLLHDKINHVMIEFYLEDNSTLPVNWSKFILWLS